MSRFGAGNRLNVAPLVWMVDEVSRNEFTDAERRWLLSTLRWLKLRARSPLVVVVAVEYRDDDMDCTRPWTLRRSLLFSVGGGKALRAPMDETGDRMSSVSGVVSVGDQ